MKRLADILLNLFIALLTMASILMLFVPMLCETGTFRGLYTYESAFAGLLAKGEFSVLKLVFLIVVIPQLLVALILVAISLISFIKGGPSFVSPLVAVVLGTVASGVHFLFCAFLVVRGYVVTSSPASTDVYFTPIFFFHLAILLLSVAIIGLWVLRLVANVLGMGVEKIKEIKAKQAEEDEKELESAKTPAETPAANA